MTIISYNGTRPKIAKDCFIAENATIVGNVFLAEGCSVWFGASIRAEVESIRIGSKSNIQDNCVLHADLEYPCKIAEGVTVGHGTIVHGALIGSNCLVGMGSILLNGSEIGKNCIVAAGSLVVQGASIPENSLVMGSPAVVKRKLSSDEITRIGENARHYYEFRAQYLAENSKSNPGM
jgi:carbonic anhydrase/acetyltransferase-like protein (isoleucine patch superfamily)